MTLGRLFGVILRGQHAVGTDEDIVLDGDTAEGQQGAAEVEKAVLAQTDARSIVDVERRKDPHGVVYRLAGNLSKIFAHLVVGVPSRVHLGYQLSCPHHFIGDGL